MRRAPAFLAIILLFVMAGLQNALACTGKTLRADNFDNLQGWTSDPAMRVERNMLIVTARAAGMAGSLNDLGRYHDFDLCVLAAVVRAANGGDPAGVVFWAADNHNYYFFAVTGIGALTVMQMANGKMKLLMPWTKNGALKTGAGVWNTLQVTTKGATAHVFVNGTQVGKIDGTPPSNGGMIGLLAEATSQGPAQWAFGRLVVTDGTEPAQSISSIKPAQSAGATKPAQSASSTKPVQTASGTKPVQSGSAATPPGPTLYQSIEQGFASRSGPPLSLAVADDQDGNLPFGSSARLIPGQGANREDFWDSTDPLESIAKGKEVLKTLPWVPASLAIHPSGNPGSAGEIYFTDGTDTVFVGLNVGGKPLGYRTNCRLQGSVLQSIAIDSHGTIFAGADDGRIAICVPRSGVQPYEASLVGTFETVDPPNATPLDSARRVPLAVGPHDDLYVLRLRWSGQSSIERYAGPVRSSNATPEAVIKGPQTGLQLPSSFAVGRDGRIYVLNEALGYKYSVLEFAPDSNGDTSPAAIIGSNDQAWPPLSDPDAISVDGAGRIYVFNMASHFVTNRNGSTTPQGPSTIAIFAAGAQGAAQPVQTIDITDASRTVVSKSIAIDGNNDLWLGTVPLIDGAKKRGAAVFAPSAAMPRKALRLFAFGFLYSSIGGIVPEIALYPASSTGILDDINGSPSASGSR